MVLVGECTCTCTCTIHHLRVPPSAFVPVSCHACFLLISFKKPTLYTHKKLQELSCFRLLPVPCGLDFRCMHYTLRFYKTKVYFTIKYNKPLHNYQHSCSHNSVEQAVVHALSFKRNHAQDRRLGAEMILGTRKYKSFSFLRLWWIFIFKLNKVRNLPP